MPFLSSSRQIVQDNDYNIIISSFCNARIINPQEFSSRSAHIAAKQALYTQRKTRNYGPEIWKDSDFFNKAKYNMCIAD